MYDVMCVAVFAVLSGCVGIILGIATSRDPAVAEILASDRLLVYAVIFFYYTLINGALKLASTILRVPISAVRRLRSYHRRHIRRQLIVKIIRARHDARPVARMPRSSHLRARKTGTIAGRIK